MKFIQARNYKRTDGRTVRKIVWHDMEAPETKDTAENIARWAAGPTAPMVSWHYATDEDSVVQCVRDEDVAYAAPGANHDGIQIETAGYAKQTTAEWHDPPGILDIQTTLTARLCRKHGIPVRFLTAEMMVAEPGATGITTHAEVARAFKRSTHTDPGRGFPTGWAVAEVRRKMVRPLRRGRIVASVGGVPIAVGHLKSRRFVRKLGAALAADGARAPFLMRVDGKPIMRGRLWSWVRPFNRRVNKAVRQGKVVSLSDNVSLQLEATKTT